MSKFFVAFLMVVLSGCGASIDSDWNRAAETHICSTEQMARVEKEMQFCSKNTNYLSTYCYGSAILRICERKTPGADHGD